MSDQYSIELAQLPIVMGAAGHNYLVLKDGQGNIIRELHGLATDEDGPKMIGWLPSDMLKVYERAFEIFPNPDGERTTVFSGSIDQAFALWERAQEAMLLMNNADIGYSMFGFDIFSPTENSNAVASTLMAAMGIIEPARLSTRLTPGSHNILLSVAQLSNIQNNHPMPSAGEGAGGSAGEAPADPKEEAASPIEVEVPDQDYYFLVSTDNGDGSWTKEIYTLDGDRLGGWIEREPDVKPGLPDNPEQRPRRIASLGDGVLLSNQADSLIASMAGFGGHDVGIASFGATRTQTDWSDRFTIAA